MKNVFALIILLGGVFSLPALAVQTGEQAPNFVAKGADGKTYNLADYKDKLVVLEWYNDDCPYVDRHYESENMQTLQKKYTAEDVVWFSVISSAPGKQGHVTAEQAQANQEKRKAAPTSILLDPAGELGQLYSAKTTPHMYIINKQGKLSYQGAIDNMPIPFQLMDKMATPTFANALDAVMAGKNVEEGTTKPYGCSVKY